VLQQVQVMQKKGFTLADRQAWWWHYWTNNSFRISRHCFTFYKLCNALL